MSSHRILLSLLLFASPLVAACDKDDGGSSGGGDYKALEARVAKLEAEEKKYHEMLAKIKTSIDENEKRQAAQQAEEEASQPAEDATFSVGVAGNVIDGPADALVTVVYAWDFACPYCMMTSSVMEELVKEYSGKVRVAYKNLVVHPDAVMHVHLAGCAAAKQGKFLEFKNAFWEKGFGPYSASKGRDREALSLENVMAIASELGMNAGKLKTDMNSPECKSRIASDMAEMERFHVNATPSFFINGREIIGGMDKEGFKAIIDEKLKIAEASGVPAKDYYETEIVAKGEKVFRSKKDPKPH
jgi:protein-disulfide isomerase